MGQAMGKRLAWVLPVVVPEDSLVWEVVVRGSLRLRQPRQLRSVRRLVSLVEGRRGQQQARRTAPQERVWRLLPSVARQTAPVEFRLVVATLSDRSNRREPVRLFLGRYWQGNLVTTEELHQEEGQVELVERDWSCQGLQMTRHWNWGPEQKLPELVVQALEDEVDREDWKNFEDLEEDLEGLEEDLEDLEEDLEDLEEDLEDLEEDSED